MPPRISAVPSAEPDEETFDLDELDDEQRRELEQRIADVRSGRALLIDGDVVLERLRARALR